MTAVGYCAGKREWVGVGWRSDRGMVQCRKRGVVGDEWGEL